MQVGPLISLSPSFNSYTNPKLAEIAARVADEFDSEFNFDRKENSAQERADQQGGVSNYNRNLESDAADGDGDFDFAFETRGLESSSQIPADEIFQNGKIRPVYPFSSRNLLLGHVRFQNGNEKGNDNRNSDLERPKTRHPLRKLFIEERETTSSSSSSDADDLDGAAAESYCLWRRAAAEDGQGNKSSSAGGSSKRWRFKDLIGRSHSNGSKNSIVVLTNSNSARKKEDEKKVNETPVGGTGVKVNPAPPPPYNRYGGEKRRSYLPYRRDLVGFFGNMNGLRKNLERH